MQKEFEKYLEKTCHCAPEKAYLVTVSGGIDSVVMARLFQQGQFEFAMAHCNFELRGQESDGDQEFVENLAAEYGVTCHTRHFDTVEYARTKGLSVQMAARELRYDWFAQLKREFGYAYICVGHNLNDLVETALLNFIRGTGIRGLSGMKPRQADLVRPLLFLSRDEIRSYAEQTQIMWREDSSNASIKYTRNRIRHVVIPELEKINPSFLNNAAETVVRLNQSEQLMQGMIGEIRKKVCIRLPNKILIDIEKLREYPAVETILFELLREYGCSTHDVPSILGTFDALPGKTFYTRSHLITRDRTQLIVTRRKITVEDEVWIEPETAHINFPLQLALNIFARLPDFLIPSESHVAALDADLLRFPLKLRRWKAGDHFIPLGMQGSKKISNFLIDNKIALPDKDQVWVLKSGEDIAWVINHRIDDRYKITARTRKILLVEYKPYPEIQV